MTADRETLWQKVAEPTPLDPPLPPELRSCRAAAPVATIMWIGTAGVSRVGQQDPNASDGLSTCTPTLMLISDWRWNYIKAEHIYNPDQERNLEKYSSTRKKTRSLAGLFG